MIMDELNNFKAPKNKLARMVNDGVFIPVVKGLYETDKTIPGYFLANSIYGPSYLSFDFALAYYGLIPEAVYTFTSATFEKNRTKRYETPFGVFTYRDVPSSVYSYGISYKTEGEYVYQIAIPEKALCDKLYTISPIGNQKELINLLFDDLRIDKASFNRLDFDIIDKLCELYHCTNLKILQKLLR